MDESTLEPIAPEDAAAELNKQAPRAESRSARTLPKRIGAYDVLAEINRGGMGMVYKAIDPQLRRLVAIKVLLAGEGAREEDVKRFQREAQATARLQHPNIVPIYAVGTHEGKPYLVMDFVEGRTAKEIKEAGQMTPRLALSIIEAAAEGLYHAHEHGVIHRDVKPANIIVGKDERIQVMDFGLARRVDEDLEVTQSGTTMGTPSYMAPEQAEGKLTEVDARSDVYSLGACLYELLTGRPPFEAPTIMATLKKVLEQNPVPPRKLNARIHRDVETICLKCLEKDKRNRYPSGKALAEEVRRFNAGESISAKPLGFLVALFRIARQHKELTAAALVVLLAGIGALALTASEWRRMAREHTAQREQALRGALDKGRELLGKSQDAVQALGNTRSAEFQQELLRARGLIAEAGLSLRQAEGIAPDNIAVRRALAELKKRENDLEVQRYIHKARMFLNPPPGRPGEPAAVPNYAGAEFAAQEAVDRDPENAEARKLLRAAIGARRVAIESIGEQAEVFARRIVDGAGRPVSANPGEIGKALGPAPVRGKELELGLYILTFRRNGFQPQQATLSVERGPEEEEVSLRLTINTPEENMVQISAGNVSLPQQGVVKLPAFAIDRYEFPNRAGVAPLTGVPLLEAQSHCRQQGKMLCNSAQWLRACMGDEAWIYPYGKNYLPNTCATGFDGGAQKRPLFSGQFPRCRTPEGVYDMSGNAAEWTESDQEETVFGGDWSQSTSVAQLTISCRARFLPEEVRKERLGFRCCKQK